MRLAVVVALASLSVSQVARAGGPDRPVIGGSDAPSGKWPDAAAILYTLGDMEGQECSGILVAPTVVLTAGHCDPAVDADIGTLTHVLLGTNSLANPSDGETLGVTSITSYPESQTSIDISVIVLAQAAREKPRPIATGWARFDIKNGASVEFVGYGAIDMAGMMYVNTLQEAESTITDFDCSMSSGCNAAAQPDGELGAGGNGIDTCPGDSGGPMYLLAGYGVYVAGVTSRSYDDATVACSQGGIYERPDKVIDWIEQTAGVPVSRGPEPTAGTITAVPGGAGETQIAVNDPKSSDHDFVVKTSAVHASTVVRDDGRVRICVDPTASAGSDEMVVTVVDSDDNTRSLDVTIPITITAGNPPPSCNLLAFTDTGGCCDSGRSSGGAIPLAMAVLALLRRRRR